MSDTADRAVTTDFATEDRSENTMRPQELSEFIGQQTVRENLSVFINAAKNAARHSIIPCSLARLVWVKRH